MRLHPRRQHAVLEHRRAHHHGPTHVQRLGVHPSVGLGRLGVVGRVPDHRIRFLRAQVQAKLRVVDAALGTELWRRQQTANRFSAVDASR